MQQAIETFRYHTGLYIQTTGFIVAADALLIGYGVAQKKAAPLFVASVMPLILLTSLWRVLSHLIPIAYVAMRCEAKLLPNEETLVATYLKTRFISVYKRVEPILGGDVTPDERMKILHRGPMVRTWGYKTIPFALIVAFVAQVALCFLATRYFHYSIL